MKLLIGGIGNIFHADDAFGIEVVRRLAARPLPESVHLVDFGIRGFDLGYALLDESYDHVLLVDLVQRGGSPGTIYLIEPEISALDRDEGDSIVAQSHNMDPAKVLTWVVAQGGKLDRVRILGCEPENLGSEEFVLLRLSPPVEAAVDQAVRIAHHWIQSHSN